jgi:hypothetical protein
MNVEEEQSENLFSYGTLQMESVQLETFGRTLEGWSDTLVGFRVRMIRIQDEDFADENGAEHRIIQFTGNQSDVVEGIVLAMTRKEMDQADAYEPAEYKRILVRLRSGVDAWVYVDSRQ